MKSANSVMFAILSRLFKRQNPKSFYGKTFHFLPVLAVFLCIPGQVSAAEIPQWWKDVHQYDPTQEPYEYLNYTSGYFGPNALPVPELYDGRIPKRHQAEVSSDVFWGFGDQTQSLSTRLTYVPLPGRLSVSLWGVLAEHYRTTPAVRDQRASIVESGEQTLTIGDAYFSTLIGLLRESRYLPDLNLEIALKTAASKSPYSARYFDTPGYWFDLTAGKSFYFSGAFVRELRLVGMYGFLCYQLNSASQNDAHLFGGKVILSSNKWSFENGLNGYSGWLNKGDLPLVFRSKLSFQPGRFNYFMQYQHALRDYPFRRLQTGIRLDF